MPASEAASFFGSRAMNRRHLLALLAASAIPARAASSSAPIDRMPAFWSVYDKIRAASIDQRVATLIEKFFVPEEAVLRRAGINLPKPPQLAQWLTGFDPMAEAVRTVHARLVTDYRVNLDRFINTFRDFDAGASPVYLVPSLFRFDAHLEPDGQSLPLFFSPDGIVKHHGADAHLAVLMAHEIFHCYQCQRNPSLSLDPAPPLYVGVWIEGTATYASEQLNPAASLKHVLLDDAALLRDGPPAASRIAGELLERIDSTTDADTAAFLGSGYRGDWPARAGYYLGLLAARRIGHELSLSDMASLPAAMVRERLIAALTDIRRNGPASP
jgi:hypothetical protein